jgi:predicted glutamine amidotransferase
MCRWNAYLGQPLLIGELLYRTKHGLIDESLHSRMGAETTNGDGFGVGWYGIDDRTVPARYRSVNPAWNDVNLRELADQSNRLSSLPTSARQLGAPSSRRTAIRSDTDAGCSYTTA